MSFQISHIATSPHRRIAALLVLLMAVPCVAAPAQQPLSLEKAIEMAQKQGLQARMINASRDAARARDRSFGARYLPQLSLNATAPSYNRSIVPVMQPDGTTLYIPVQSTDASVGLGVSQRIPMTGGTLSVSSGLDRLAVTGVPEKWSSTPVQVSLTQGILRPNGMRWDLREQDLRTDIAERQYLEQREDVALTTSNAFFDLYVARKNLENAIANAAINDTLYKLNKGRFEIGKIGENDLLQNELELLRSQAALDGARLDHERALAALRLAINVPPGTRLEIVVPDAIPEFNADTTIAMAQALKNRSGETELQLQDVQARRRVVEAKFNSGVGATVNASIGFNATATDANTAYKNLLQAQRFSLGVSVPLIQWGARGADIQAAQADQERLASSARINREQTAQSAYFAALQLAQAKRNADISAKADTVAAKRFEVAYNRYVIGKIGIDNLYIAQTAKDQAVQAYVQSLRNYWGAYYQLRKLTLYDFMAGKPIQ